MSTDPNPEKKIIIDEDWKSRVEAERTAAGEPNEADAAGAEPDMAWPEPSLMLLATTLATQAMIALGVVPHPVTNRPAVDLRQAKHFIDMLGVLFDKTKGNRTEEETTLIEHTLHELRMAYVAIGERTK